MLWPETHRNSQCHCVLLLHKQHSFYDVDKLPFSEAFTLAYLYVSSVNRGLSALADAAYSRLHRPRTRIGERSDIKSVLYLVLYGQVGKKSAGQKRTREIREAVVEQFAMEILTRLDEDDIDQYVRDNAEFASMLLQAVISPIRRSLWETGFDRDEVD